MTEDLLTSGLFDKAGAVAFRRGGHFLYESGLHGDTRLALELLFADPERLRLGCTRLATRLKRHAPDVVCGPLVGGALVGQWVAYDLSAAFVVAERQPRTAIGGAHYALAPALRSLLPNRRVIIVDDAINAGAATLACAHEISAWGGRVMAAGSLLARIPDAPALLAEHGIQLDYLVGLRWHVWTADDCPLCQAGVPIEPAT